MCEADMYHPDDIALVNSLSDVSHLRIKLLQTLDTVRSLPRAVEAAYHEGHVDGHSMSTEEEAREVDRNWISSNSRYGLEQAGLVKHISNNMEVG